MKKTTKEKKQLQADRNHFISSGCELKPDSHTSVTERNTVFLIFSSTFLHLPCFYKSLLIKENFPPYPFLGGLLPLALQQQQGVPTCAHSLEIKKKNIPTSIREVVGATADAHTCNMTESFSSHHFSGSELFLWTDNPSPCVDGSEGKI